MNDSSSFPRADAAERQLAIHLANIACTRLLTDSERMQMAMRAEIVRYPSGGQICADAGPLVILDGKARLVRAATDQHKEQVVALLNVGDLCFEAELFTEPEQANVNISPMTLVPNGNVTVARLSSVALKGLAKNALMEKALAALASQGLRTFLRNLESLSVALDPAALRSLLVGFRPSKFLAGDHLSNAGNSTASFIVLGSGRARRNMKDASQSPRLLLPGDFFGESAICLGVPETSTVTALSDGDCFKITAQDYQRLCAGTPSLQTLFSTLVNALATRGRSTNPTYPESDIDPEELDDENDSEDEEFSREATSHLAPSGWRRWTRRRFPYRRQLDMADCGPACLGMVLDHYSIKATPSRLRELCAVSRQGSSLYSMADAAETLGLRTRGVEASFEDLSSVALPAIAHVGTNHFVVIYDIRGKDVVIADPAKGVERISAKDFKQLWKGALLIFRPSRKIPSTEEPSEHGLKLFFRYLAPHRGVLTEILIGAVALQFLGLAVPLITQTIIDRVLVHEEVDLLNALLMVSLGVAVFSAILRTLRRLLLFEAARAVDRAVVTDFHHRLFHLPMRFFASRKLGDLLVRFSDNHKVRRFLTSTVFGAMLDLCLGTVYLGVVFLYDFELALWGILPIPFLIILGMFVTPAIRRNRRVLVQRRADKESTLIEGLTAIGTVKGLNAETAERRRFEALFDAQLATELSGVRLSTISRALAGLIVAAGGALVLYVGALHVLQGVLTLGSLVAVTALLSQVLGPALKLVGVWERYQETSVALERLADVLNAQPEEDADGRLVDLPTLEGHVRMDDVTFRYEKDLEPALSNVSFEILPGEKVAIVGRSGAGKSTLAELILKLYQPESGSIYLDGHDLRSVSARSLRRQVGMVPQKIDIFSGTISANIAFGRECTQTEITEAAKAAGAHDFIIRRPYGYETIVGERSTARFSGGELQRLAIARTLVGKPQVLLLDEPSSALDAEAETALMHSFEKTVGTGTLIILTHRLAFMRRADLILVIDAGRLVEQGTHTELIARGGVYATLHSEQDQ